MRIAVAGYKGRMGQMLVSELGSGAWGDLIFARGSTSSDDPALLFQDDVDVVIDFTTPKATLAHIQHASKSGKAIVIGTTGLSDDDMKQLNQAAQSCPLLFSANMSVGVNLLAMLVEQASKILGDDFDAEIFETHHHHKVDAPSGTALMLGKATGRPAASYDRNGKRVPGTVGYAVQRGGDVVGEHNVTFFGAGERIELGHRAHNRSLFAKGALRAAHWLHGKPHGFYTMRNVLSL